MSSDRICVGHAVSIEAEVDNQCEADETWSAPGGDPDEGEGTAFSTKWNTPGEKTITFECGDESDSVNVTVVAVDKVIIDGSDPPDEGPATVCVGMAVTLRAISAPPGASFPEGSPKWTITEQPDNSQIPHPADGNTTAEITPDLPGPYVVTASCGTSSKSFTINAVAVEKVIVDGSDPEEEGPVAICHENGSIALRAKPLPPDASFPAGSPKWEITEQPNGSQIPNPPSGSATAEVDPDLPGTYQIKSSCGTSSKTFTLHAVRVQITDAQDNPITTPQTVIVGQKVTLRRKIEPVIAPDEELWEIGGSAIKNYTQTATEELAEGKVHPLNFNDLIGSEVEFYWIAGDDAVDVIYAAKFGEAECINTVTFQVKRPVATLTSTITPLVPPTDIRSGRMRFGIAIEEVEGINWNATVTTPNDGAGEIAFVQLINTIRTGTLIDGTNLLLSSNGQFVLDSEQRTEVQYGGTTAIGSAESKSHKRDDSPSTGLAGLKKSGANDNFRLYLMYKPNGGIWVTLRRLEWHWMASAALEGDNWVMDPGQSPANADNPPGSNDSTHIPEWITHVRSLEVETIPP